MSKYKQPILSHIYTGLGVFAFIGSAFLLIAAVAQAEPNAVFAGVMAALPFFFAALICFGISQLINYIGKTAHYTKQAAHTLEESVARLDAMLQRMNSNRPFLVRLDDVRKAPPLVAKGSQSQFYFSENGKSEGPFPADDLRNLKESGIISSSTSVLRSGDDDWKAYEDFDELK